MNKKGVIDIGTSSVKGFVFEKEHDVWRLIDVWKYDCSLSGALSQSGSVAELDAERLIDVLLGLQSRFLGLGIENDHVQCFATEALRSAQNTGDIASIILQKTNIPIEVLSQEDEMRRYRIGLVRDFTRDGPIVAIDIGGGSVQCMYGDGNGLHGWKLRRTGVSFLLHTYVADKDAPTLDELAIIRNVIIESVDQITQRYDQIPLFIHGGTCVIDFFEQNGSDLIASSYSLTHPYAVHRSQLYALYDTIVSLPYEARGYLFPSNPGFMRGAMIGLLYVLTLMEKYSIDYEIPSNNNLVYGFL